MTIFELIDFRSFSNIWYWLAAGLLWARAMSFVLGIPVDLIHLARKGNEKAIADLDMRTALEVRRRASIATWQSTIGVALTCLALSTLAILGFAYKVEFAQAVVLQGIPLALAAVLAAGLSGVIATSDLHGADLARRMMRHNRIVRLIGLTTLFLTALYGMYRNLSIYVI